jgi:RNA 3'-terminal phosphate cyclase (ATP)
LAPIADQLLLLLALAGSGAFITLRSDRHILTNIEVIRRFLSLKIDTSQLAPDDW